MITRHKRLYDAHAAKEAHFEEEYLKHISAHYDIETRYTEHFAWAPKRMKNGSLIWLKSYIIYEKYYSVGETVKVLHVDCYTTEDWVEAKLKGEIKIG